jgi:ABC-type phosphate transport system substrate-binding protein
MRKILMALAALTATIALVGAAGAHPATEQFIPIGKSPGDGTVQGRAGAAVQPQAGGSTEVVPVQTATAEQNIVVGPRTRVYIDRSAQGQPNTVGTLADVQPGRVIEARINPETRYADWVKVRP